MKIYCCFVCLFLFQLPSLVVPGHKTRFVQSGPDSARLVNTTHLDHLYQTVKLNGAAVGLINIYSEYPDYKWVADDDEGAACVDDIARTVLFLVHEPDLTTNTSKQDKLRKLTEFVLQLQSENGYFYNFIFGNLSINKAGSTSINQPNWWSWRALWSLTEAYPYYKTADPVFAVRLQTASKRLVANMIRDFGSKPQAYQFVKGLKIPTWLPYGSGTDQAAIMMLGLLNYYQQTPDGQVLKLIGTLGDGIVQMQFGTAGQVPYGAIMSFENRWHAYGSDQSYALLRAGKALNRPDWTAVARREVDNFYPYLLKEGFLESFDSSQQGTSVSFDKKSRFSQIAYGVRPMVWATLELYDQTKDTSYVKLAGQLAGWFWGNNPARAIMYDKATGLGFDGITSETRINKNSGAESTIESLLTFQRLENYPDAIAQANKYH
ncbi:hypothetical protein [Spirosoma endbachense]|uniref:Uncharacterized protein n=1 Tax=Spirosoma endbachense TaxID=2666025 RepID=A0A6P1W2R4_9BACT|nr:hypothetical protein [Spirosoma endbachense]QHV98592.1 hypothetical protein GJR95_27890 [Spirosoma endbachense]